MDKYHVVLHLDEPSKGRAEQVFGNIANLLNDLGDENVEVELLANGGGVRSLVKDSNGLAEQIIVLAKRGVCFTACRNSLDHLNIQPSELLDQIQIVPAGVSELVKKQAQGWAYIRP